jgi:stress-induced morphogen
MMGRVFDYEEVAPRVMEALRRVFPSDTIEVSEGGQGHVYALVVSSRFNGREEMERQRMFWDALRAEMGEDAVAVVLAALYGTEDLRPWEDPVPAAFSEE